MSQEHLADPVLLEQHQGLARITLNRPAKYNALSEEVLDSLQHILDKLTSLYVRVYARLIHAAERVEAELGLEPLPEPTSDSSDV